MAESAMPLPLHIAVCLARVRIARFNERARLHDIWLAMADSAIIGFVMSIVSDTGTCDDSSPVINQQDKLMSITFDGCGYMLTFWIGELMYTKHAADIHVLYDFAATLVQVAT